MVARFGSPARLNFPLKIGVLKYDKRGVDEDVNNAVKESAEFLKSLGYEVKEIELPNIKYAVPCYYILVPAEVSSNLARFDGIRYGLFKEGKNLTEDYMESRRAGFGAETRRRIMLGTYVLSAGYYDDYYIKAQKVRALIRRDFQKVFQGVDAILSPVSPTPAFKIGEKTNDPLKMYLEDIFTAPANMTGLPAISIPSGFVKEGGVNLPVGIQFMAPHGREDILFEVGKKFETVR